MWCEGKAEDDQGKGGWPLTSLPESCGMHSRVQDPRGARGRSRAGRAMLGASPLIQAEFPGKAARCPQAKGGQSDLHTAAPRTRSASFQSAGRGREKPLQLLPLPACTHPHTRHGAAVSCWAQPCSHSGQSYLMATARAALRVHRGREAAPIHALIPGNTARFKAALRPSERAPPATSASFSPPFSPRLLRFCSLFNFFFS